MCCFTCFTILVQDSWGTNLSIRFMAAWKPPDVMLQNAGSQLCCPESAGPNKTCLCPSQGPSMKWKPSTSSDNSLKVGKCCWEFDLHTDLTAESYEIIVWSWNVVSWIDVHWLQAATLIAKLPSQCQGAQANAVLQWATVPTASGFWFGVICVMTAMRVWSSSFLTIAVLDLMRGVGYMHSKNVIHRDLKQRSSRSHWV